jgi:hypothetical protein
MRAIEGENKTLVVAEVGPSGGLNGTAYFQRQLAEMFLPRIYSDPAFIHQPAQISVGADVVESMVVNTEVADMRGHVVECPFAADVQKPFVSSGVELQDRRPKLKPLCPLGPTPRGIAPFNREYGCSTGGFPSLLQLPNLLTGEFEEFVKLRFEA